MINDLRTQAKPKPDPAPEPTQNLPGWWRYEKPKKCVRLKAGKVQQQHSTAPGGVLRGLRLSVCLALQPA